MSRRSKIRTRRKPRNLAYDNMALARARVERLSDEHVTMQRGLIETAFDRFRKGIDCEFHWCSLADTAEVSQTLAGMGLGSGPEADRIIGDAKMALQAVKQRKAERGTWTLYPAEIEALDWLITLHGSTQLPACSYGEFDEAFHATHRRLRQALAGNAAPGKVVVVGDMGRPARSQQPPPTQLELENAGQLRLLP
jgi:hypothetical protein